MFTVTGAKSHKGHTRHGRARGAG